MNLEDNVVAEIQHLEYLNNSLDEQFKTIVEFRENQVQSKMKEFDKHYNKLLPEKEFLYRRAKYFNELREGYLEPVYKLFALAKQTETPVLVLRYIDQNCQQILL